jgi:DNA-binding NtrC family response regulator
MASAFEADEKRSDVLIQGAASTHADSMAEPEHATHVGAVEDEEIAAASAASVLITGPTDRIVDSLARRIHDGAHRAAYPFVRVRAGELPDDAQTLGEICSKLRDAAQGGTILVTDVETMAPVVQELLIGLLAHAPSAHALSPAARLVTGTTVSLPDRIAAGTFSERLFYRLNVIHLVVPGGCSGGDKPASCGEVNYV